MTRMAFATCPVTGVSPAQQEPPSSGCPFASPPPNTSTPRADPTLAIPTAYRHASLTPEQKALIRSSVPALQSHGVTMTKLFYDNLLAATPALRDVFNAANQAHLEQPRALADAVLAYALNLDDLTPLGPTVELVANRHASLLVRPEHYALVGAHLIAAMVVVLAEAVTAELVEAWTKAYWMLAEVFITREEELYRKARGWTGWADFRIAKKVKETDEVTSFYLEPVDDSWKPLPPFLPGQYISIQIDVPQLGHRQARQYSLSDQPDSSYYRISIKAERNDNEATRSKLPGLISVLMHDTKNEGDVIQVSHPRGDFFLDASLDDSPLVLISAGVGLTPLTSMLNSLVGANSSRPISWIHGARHNRVRAFKEHTRDVAQSHPNIQIAWFNDHPKENEVEGQDYHYRGYIDLDKLDQEKSLFINSPLTQYYVCGPPSFMVHVSAELQLRGVSPDRVHLEKFGTGSINA